MSNARGVVLTNRDRALLAYVGIARYTTADQVHRLIAPDRSKKLVYRRLAKLCLPGGRPGEGACLRRLHYRRFEGTRVPVWALTPYGRSLVTPAVPWLPPPAASDVGARFLEHTLLLNDVLLRLVLMFRRSASAPLGALPFRWLAEGDQVLRFRHFVLERVPNPEGVLKPDTILELDERGLRIFVEAETGTQSIVTAHPDRTGAVVAKLRRYQAFLHAGTGDPDQTWYRKAFHDGKTAQLLFIVHSADRLQRVEKAIREALGRQGGDWVLVFTFAEAAEKLLAYLPAPVTPPAPRADLAVAGHAGAAREPPALAAPAARAATPATPAAPALALDQRQLDYVRKVFVEMATRFDDIETIVARHRRATNCRVDRLPIPRDQLLFLAKVIIYGQTSPVRWPAEARPEGR